MSAPQIAGLVRSDESHVRKVIHAFNEEGFGSLDPDYRGRRPKKTTPEQRDRIVAVARARPDTQGVALTRWSLAKLAEHLAGLGIALSEEALRQTLRGGELVASAHAVVEVERGPRLRCQSAACSGAQQSQT
jgi:transposase